MERQNLPNFEDFISNTSKKIYEAEAEPSIFKGLGNDPYQYMIKGDKAYYAEKTKGELNKDSSEWKEQKYQRGIKEIKNLYKKISSTVEGIDQETKNLVMEIQTALNKVKKKLPKLWTLPLDVDGRAGWKTAWTYKKVVVDYPYTMHDINDSSHYSVNDYKDFKENAKEDMGVENGLSYLYKTSYDTEQSSDIEKLKSVLKRAQDASDGISGTLRSNSSINFLVLTSLNTTIPENLNVEMLTIREDCPIKNIPSTLSCKYLVINNYGEAVNLPPIEVKDLMIYGKVKLSDEWKRIESLSIYDNNLSSFEGGSEAYSEPIPANLKQFGRLTISSSAVNKLPDNITVGKIKVNIVPSSDLVKDLENTRSYIDPIVIKKIKKPFFKRIFSKGENKYESLNNKIYEEEIDDFFTSTAPILDLSGCIDLKTLPVGLSVNGDFIISQSGLLAFTDEEIREVCVISGNIIRQ